MREASVEPKAEAEIVQGVAAIGSSLAVTRKHPIDDADGQRRPSHGKDRGRLEPRNGLAARFVRLDGWVAAAEKLVNQGDELIALKRLREEPVSAGA